MGVSPTALLLYTAGSRPQGPAMAINQPLTLLGYSSPQAASVALPQAPTAWQKGVAPPSGLVTARPGADVGHTYEFYFWLLLTADSTKALSRWDPTCSAAGVLPDGSQCPVATPDRGAALTHNHSQEQRARAALPHNTPPALPSQPQHHCWLASLETFFFFF